MHSGDSISDRQTDDVDSGPIVMDDTEDSEGNHHESEKSPQAILTQTI